MYCFSPYKQSKTLVVLLCFFFLSTNAQLNFILNPSFEDSTLVPTGFSEISKCQVWYAAFGTPDYFSSYSPTTNSANCNFNTNNNWAGKQNAKHGNNYVGIIQRSAFPENGYPAFSNYFELIGSPLGQTLMKDHVYDFSLFYSVSESSGRINNQLSAYFSSNQFSISSASFNPLDQNWYNLNINNVNPQVNHDTTQYLSSDTINWQLLTQCFIAVGTEAYITIGNFRDGIKNKTKIQTNNFNYPCAAENSSLTCYFYIDDLSLYDRGYYSGKANCRSDTSICFNRGQVIGNNVKDSATYFWQPTSDLSCTNCPNPIASPTITTKYVLTKTLCSFITKDSITVTVFTPSVSASAGSNKTLCFNEFTQLGINDSTAFTNYNWQPSSGLTCTNCSMPFATPASNITYTLQKTECAINSTSTVQITVQDCETTYTVPNIFTPNNDNVNDTWGIKFNQVRDITDFVLDIYNRWGVPICQTNLPRHRWDGYTTSGIPCPDGVYVFVCTFTINGEKKELKGNITLIR
jgi:gliding motility-associated-like protein